MGNTRLVKAVDGNALDLNGHDQWVEVYRQSNVEIESNELTLTMDVYPRKLISSCGSFLTKVVINLGYSKGVKIRLISISIPINIMC